MSRKQGNAQWDSTSEKCGGVVPGSNDQVRLEKLVAEIEVLADEASARKGDQVAGAVFRSALREFDLGKERLAAGEIDTASGHLGDARDLFQKVMRAAAKAAARLDNNGELIDHALSTGLLHLFNRGDDDALELLAIELEPYLLKRIDRKLPSYLRARVSNRDIYQDTLIELVKMRDEGTLEIHGVRPLKALLKMIADRMVTKYLRQGHAQKRDIARERAEPANQDDPFGGAASPVSSPSQNLHREELHEIYHRCLKKLDSEQRGIIRLVSLDEMKYPEIARTLHISEEAARQRYSRAMSKLGKLMAKYYPSCQ